MITIEIFERGQSYRKGRFYIDGILLGYTLERTDAYIYQRDRLTEIEFAKKVIKCAIPYGNYQVKLEYSPRFNRLMPRVVNVPGFEGILFHWGNEPKDTEGCILLGLTHETGKAWISKSRYIFDLVIEKYNERLTSGLKLEIVSGYGLDM